MPIPPLRFDSVDALRPAFDAIRAELDVHVDFPADVVAEAEESARRGPAIPASRDLRDLPFVSVDPEGSRDLDQAVAIARATPGSGYVVHYAIADAGAFVVPGGAIDREARRRGVTVYLPDRRASLHPPVLSEGAASLLPGDDRQALVWRFELDAEAALGAFHIERATVRSRRAYSYVEAQAKLDAGRADETVALLAEVGSLLEQRETARGGVALNVPEQIVEATDGRYQLHFRAPLPLEGWNAQISLLTGMAAADIMMRAGVGILRTLPVANDDDVMTLRRHARGLGVEWAPSVGYADFIRVLDPTVPDHAALLVQAGRLFRGAGYEPFDLPRGVPLPPEPTHAAVAAPYAHVTAPLRRLVDRFGNEIVLAAFAGSEPPSWARDALADLPALMADGRRREGGADGRAADLVEAAVLAGCVGEVLDGVVVRLHRRGAQVQIRTPAVVANVHAKGTKIGLGDEIKVRVEAADPGERRVDLAVVS